MPVWHPAIQAWLRNSLRRFSVILFCFLLFLLLGWLFGWEETIKEEIDAPSRASGRGHLFLFRWRSNNVEVMLTLLVDVVPGF